MVFLKSKDNMSIPEGTARGILGEDEDTVWFTNIHHKHLKATPLLRLNIVPEE